MDERNFVGVLEARIGLDQTSEECGFRGDRIQFELVQTPYSRQTMIHRVRLLSEPSLSNKSRVRGRPFKHGNPGRPHGSKNKVTQMVEELVENDGENLTRKIIELAKDGDVRCLLWCIDRLWPQRRGEPINLDLPKIDQVQDVAPAIAAVARAASKGTITTEQASQIVGVLNSFATALSAADFAVRLEKVESVLKLQGKI
jgi:hypothetical protein